MGIPIMSNIHEPAAASTTSRQALEGEGDDAPLQELIQQKERVESELSALGSVLDSVRITMPRCII